MQMAFWPTVAPKVSTANLMPACVSPSSPEGCSSANIPAASEEITMSEANKAVIRRLVDGYWIKRDVKVFDEVFAARFIDHHPMPGVPGTKEGLR